MYLNISLLSSIEKRMSSTQNCAIFILTQNTEAKKVYLKTNLYYLFKYFNKDYKHPVVIFHEGDFDEKLQTDIINGIRESCRSCVSFRTLDPDDFKVPDHIDSTKLERCISTAPTPYWRNVSYRSMCRWWVVHMPKYAAGYDYVMRIDDDAFIEEPLPDLFSWAEEKKVVYASNMVHTDCGMCNYGMMEFFKSMFPEKKELIDSMFTLQNLPSRSVKIHPFRTLLSITQDPLPEIGEHIPVYQPTIFYNNFFITKSSFWQREDVQEAIKKIDKNGSIYYFRWGDAPLHTLLVKIFAEPHEVKQCIFKYSKRMQRESFPGNDGMFHSYMPGLYEQTSCITET
jgi:hypothetical protein